MYSLTKSIIVLVLLFGAVLAYALPLDELVERAPQPNWPAANIEAIGYAGTGCPANTVKITPQNNFEEVKLDFDAYIATIGPNVPVTEHRKNCAITILISHTPGWCVTVYQGYYHGRLQLDSGIKATQQSDYWWDGDTATLASYWEGEIKPEQTYDFIDTVPKQVWSPPNGNSLLKINTQIKLDNSKNPNGEGYITTDSITNKVTHICFLKWKEC
ncbi:hypothetical protein BDZ91DRAFT_660452 [Kalaharituber pfeilii]|nr:hypothetical protein BDZ91DRAFT_660452 [Kalaharituber pfeilii]